MKNPDYMKISSVTIIWIFLFILLLTNRNCYGSIINVNDNYVLNLFEKNIDSTKLETKFGVIDIITECDSNSGWTTINGQLYDSVLIKISEVSEKLHIDSDEGSLIFELYYKGQLIECKFGKPAKLKEFSILLQQLATEINMKYKYVKLSCYDIKTKNNTYYEIPFKFQLL